MRSYNSTFPRCLMFNGRLYDSASQLHNDAQQAAPVVTLASFCGRVRRLALANNLSESSVADALQLNAAAYTAKYATRKTWVTLDDQRVALGDFFDQSCLQRAVSYPNFRTRIKSLVSRAMLDSSSMNDALNMPYGDWVSFYGGGRRNGFCYHGDEHPEQSGKHFSSIAAFLRQTGRYGDRQLIWSRLKSGWCFSHALTIPAAISSLSPGTVYMLVRKSTGEVYVGLTVCGLDQRWSFHVRAAFDGSTTKLARAIREDGESGFERFVLEEGIEDVETLRQREIFWVEYHQALGPNGLNTLKPGGLGRPSGIPTTVDGITYRSQNEAARCRSITDNVPVYLARAYIVKNCPIPARPRAHSKHPEAGSNLWRRWQALLRRYPSDVIEPWASNYDTFKADVGFSDPALQLVRIDHRAPWGAENFKWLTAQQKVEAEHGKAIWLDGVEYPSLTSFAQAHGLSVSTLKDRIRRQRLSIGESVQRPLRVTTRRMQGIQVVTD